MLAWALHVIVTRMDGRLDLSTIPPLPAASATTTTAATTSPLARWGAAITSVAGAWATLALNIPDFARFAKGERAQVLGQALGLPLSLYVRAWIICMKVRDFVCDYGDALTL